MLPGQQEGCSGTRNLEDNISDLKAQVAANNKVGLWLVFVLGIKLLRKEFLEKKRNELPAKFFRQSMQ